MLYDIINIGNEIVIAVHTFGAAADISMLKRQSRTVIEDCCQALGGTVAGIPLGSNGDVAVFSFYATKIITGGQGGLIWSRTASVIDKIRDYRQFDCRYDYEPRFNFQMSDIQAALVNNQMGRLASIRNRRAEIAEAYLSSLPKGLITRIRSSDPSRMVYRFVVEAPDLPSREALRTHMEAANIGCIVPIERYELLHRCLKLDPVEYPVSEHLADTTLSLPMHIGLSDKDVSTICEALSKFEP